MEKPLVNQEYVLQKFTGKGGWTYVALPEVAPDKHAYFGLIKVSGFIDGYELENATLMPLGNGRVFLPVKAEIRKHIKKQAGDTVKVTLFAKQKTASVPEEIMLCLQDEPVACQHYHNCTEAQRQEYIAWVAAAKSEDEKVTRLARLLDCLEKWPPQPVS